MKMENKKFETTNERIATGKNHEQGKGSEAPRNYNQPDPLNTSCIGRSVTVTLSNGRIEAGILTGLGAYWLSIQGTTGKELLINKGQVMVVAVL